MARQERNNVDYFPHPVKHGKKMFYIRNTYGNDGYVAWFMLLEKLGDANYHYLDLQNPLEIMYLTSEIMITEEKLSAIIEDLVRLEEFDKDLWEGDKIIFNQKFIDNISDAYKRRGNNCLSDKNELLLHLLSKGRLNEAKCIHYGGYCIEKDYKNPQNKIKENKEDKNKENDIKEREQKFKLEVESFKDKYSIDMLTNFYAYWSEPTQDKKKMKMEREATWDTARRLLKWSNNIDKWKK